MILKKSSDSNDTVAIYVTGNVIQSDLDAPDTLHMFHLVKLVFFPISSVSVSPDSTTGPSLPPIAAPPIGERHRPLPQTSSLSQSLSRASSEVSSQEPRSSRDLSRCTEIYHNDQISATPTNPLTNLPLTSFVGRSQWEGSVCMVDPLLLTPPNKRITSPLPLTKPILQGYPRRKNIFLGSRNEYGQTVSQIRSPNLYMCHIPA
ncbi:1167_t:CDS:2 [Ambispora leptoticha]|uniref:1167_t:CDS:1 n=1 Tax=Ambispora leptoticha TaxID=144679 RepID=A0A9N8VFG0_9GLOM|nr:1167_t:CDS:2 [Ambispora leptoticha]